MPAPSATLHTRRVHAGGSFALALVFGALALACAAAGLLFLPLLFWPAALLLFLAALLVDSKKRTACFCSACGHEVKRSAAACAVCHTALIVPAVTRADQVKASALFFLIATPPAAFVVWWIVTHPAG